MYKLYSPNGSVSSAAIIDMLDASVPLHLAHIRRIQELETNGMTYSGEDGDVLGAAYRVARTGRTQVSSFEAGWVRRMTQLAEAA